MTIEYTLKLIKLELKKALSAFNKASYRALSLVIIMAAAGCSGGGDSVSSLFQANTLSGNVMGGRQPISGSTVYVFDSSGSGTGAPVLLGQTTTGSNGTFSISTFSQTPANGDLIYVLAVGGDAGGGINNNATLMSIAGIWNGTLGTLQLNELTSAATISQLSSNISLVPCSQVSVTATGPTTCPKISGSSSGWSTQVTSITQLVSLTTGQVTTALSSSTNGSPEYTAYANLNMLSSAIANCINSSGGVAGNYNSCGNLFTAATANGITPSDSVSALINVYQNSNPAAAISSVFQIAGNSSSAVYSPLPSIAPTNVTVAAPTLTPTVNSTAVSLNVLGTSSSVVTGNINASDPEGLSLTYTITQNGTTGNASINSSGQFTYTVAGNTTNTTDSFVVRASNGSKSATSSVTVNLNTDPLLQNQWHIQNNGVTAFSSVLPSPSYDINVYGAWAAGYSGNGIKVAVVDSGLEIAHEDLRDNVDVAHSFNFLNGTHDPTPSISGGDHGTEVAGIIGAVAFNGKGGRGIAYKSTLRGYNLTATGNNYDTFIAAALGEATYSADNDIFNESFSSISGALPPTSNFYQSITANVLTLRGGKGAILVQAAGNEFLANSYGKCNNANIYGVSCGDPSTDTRREGTASIIVGAFDANGIKSSYSNAGTALWISAPGGEYGVDSSYLSGLPAIAYYPAIVTTALDGCANASNNGFSTSRLNSLNSNGNNQYSSNCQYTSIMNGTSSATPNISGVVALMLEANPNLSYRDVKYILAATARKIHPAYSGVSTSAFYPGQGFVLDQGWVMNKAGYWFSTWYGFGAVDATAAVNMAKNYSTYLPALQSSSSALHYVSNTSVPYNSTGVNFYFNMNPGFSTVEFVEIFLNLSLTTALTCNQIELTSPYGTKSIMMHAANGYSMDGVNYQTAISGSRILSNAFYGEPSAGVWTLKFLNACGLGTTILASTDVQTLNLSGH